MASGTGLFDPNQLAWDAETLAAVGVDESQLPPVSDEQVAGVWPALGDGACSNVGAGCVGRGRVAVMVGTSAAVRVVYEAAAADPRPGLFLYRLDERRFCEGRRALGWREPARMARGDTARARPRRHRRPAAGRARARLPAVPRR